MNFKLAESRLFNLGNYYDVSWLQPQKIWFDEIPVF